MSITYILVALDSLHAIRIMHRDVKPRNVLINRQATISETTSAVSENEHSSSAQLVDDTIEPPIQQPLVLIDLGLADVYKPGQRYNVRVASRHYKSPELLTNLETYGTSLDLWGVGCLLAGLLLQRAGGEPVFRGHDNDDQLHQIYE